MQGRGFPMAPDGRDSLVALAAAERGKGRGDGEASQAGGSSPRPARTSRNQAGAGKQMRREGSRVADERLMVGEMVRIPVDTRIALKELADQTGLPVQTLVAEAVEAFRRQRLLELTNAAYAALRDDPEAWKEELAERAEWDGVLADGIDDQEVP